MNKKNIYNFVKKHFPVDIDYSAGKDIFDIFFLPDKSMTETTAQVFCLGQKGKCIFFELSINRKEWNKLNTFSKRLTLLHELGHVYYDINKDNYYKSNTNSINKITEEEYLAEKWAILQYRKIYSKSFKKDFEKSKDYLFKGWASLPRTNKSIPYIRAAKRLRKEGII